MPDLKLDLKDRWDAFFKSYPDPKFLIEQEKLAMFRHAWDNPDRDVVTHDATLWQWRYRIMQDATT